MLKRLTDALSYLPGAIWSGASPKPFSEPIESWFFSEEYLQMCRTDINPGSREDWFVTTRSLFSPILSQPLTLFFFFLVQRETFGTLIGMSRPIFAFLVRFLHLYAHARGPSSTTSSRASPAPEPYHSQAYALLAEMATIRLKIIFDPVDNIAAGKQAWESGVRVTSLGDVDDSEEREALLERRIRLGDLIWLQTLEVSLGTGYPIRKQALSPSFRSLSTTTSSPLPRPIQRLTKPLSLSSKHVEIYQALLSSA